MHWVLNVGAENVSEIHNNNKMGLIFANARVIIHDHPRKFDRYVLRFAQNATPTHVGDTYAHA